MDTQSEIKLQQLTNILLSLRPPMVQQDKVKAARPIGKGKWNVCGDAEQYTFIVQEMRNNFALWQVASKRDEISDLEAIKSRLQAFVDWHKLLHQNDNEDDLSAYTDTPINNVVRWCNRYLNELNRYDSTQKTEGENYESLLVLLRPDSKFMKFCEQEKVCGKDFDDSKKMRLLYDILGGVPEGETKDSVFEMVKNTGHFKIEISTFNRAFERSNKMEKRIIKIREEIKKIYDNQ